MSDTPRRVLHICIYCGRGAVETLPGKCPNHECGAELTLKVKDRLTAKDVAQVQQDARQEVN